MKFYKITYTAYVTRVVNAESEEAACEAFNDEVSFGDCISEDGTCTEITDPKERESAIRMHGLIK